MCGIFIPDWDGPRSPWAWIGGGLLLLVGVWLAVTIHFGGKFDSICVEGRLSQAQATAINSLPWGKCPNYRDGRCEAQVDDRILVRECSEFSRSIFYWRPW